MFMGGKMKNKELYVDYKNKYLLYGDSIILIKKGSRRTWIGSSDITFFYFLQYQSIINLNIYDNVQDR